MQAGKGHATIAFLAPSDKLDIDTVKRLHRRVGFEQHARHDRRQIRKNSRPEASRASPSSTAL